MSVLVDHIPPYGGDVLRRHACGTICTRACWLGSSGSRKHSLCANHDHDIVLPISRGLHRELKRQDSIHCRLVFLDRLTSQVFERTGNEHTVAEFLAAIVAFV